MGLDNRCSGSSFQGIRFPFLFTYQKPTYKKYETSVTFNDGTVGRINATGNIVAEIPQILIELAWDKQRAAEGKEPARIANSINYKNDFALATWAPLSLCEDGKKTYHVDIFVDKSSVELFVDGGRIAMTNLVFPVAPYENVKLYTQDGKAEFKNLKVHKLGL